MDFYEVLEHILVLLQRHGRVSYRALKRQFDLDDDFLDDLKAELLYAYSVTDDDGRGLIWTTDSATPEADVQRKAAAELRFQSLLRAVIGLLKSEGRITYRTLKHIPGLDDALLEEIQEELLFKRFAIDEAGKGLVWTDVAQPTVPSAAQAPQQSDTAETTAVASSATPALPPPVTEMRTPSNGPTAPPEAVTEAPQDEPAVPPEPASSAADAERRQLTVMFCDLADSTKLSQQLDPEDLREVVRAYQATAAKVIQRYEGHMAQYLGDGLLIYFGWPQAHEDDVQRALHASLGIVEAITTTLNSRLEQEKGVQLTVRLGVHTGPVVVGQMGGGGRHENLATGETVNIAARLEGLATPNTVVISSTTARLARGAFTLDDLGRHTLRGVVESMQVYRVLHPLAEHDDKDAGTTGRGVFLVGRDEEMGLLVRRWEQSKEGLGQVVLISGEAGIGKSSLVAAMRGYAVDEGFTRLTFRCSPYHTNSALYPVITHLEYMLGFDPDDSPAARLDKLEQVLGTTSLPLEESMPLLATLLSIPVDERYSVSILSSQERRLRTLDTLVGWLLEEAEKQPPLVAWEDLHWADPSTLELLGLVLEQTPTVSILHVLTFRPEFELPWPMRSHMTPITLNRLERPQVEALIARLAGGKALPAEVMHHIVGKTDGVPLYVEELTKMLLESDLLQQESDQYVLTGPLNTVTIPDTLQDSLMARLDQLNKAKEIAQLGAVLGREFSYELIQAVSSQDDETVQAGLAQLVDAELLYQRGRPPRARYIFKHALMQDVTYQSILRRTRQQVHQQIAEMLETRFPDLVASQPELLAHHAFQAECWEPALVYFVQAAQQRRDAFANQEAVALYSQALEAADHLGQTLDVQTLMAIHQAKAATLFVLNDFLTSRIEAERFLMLAKRAGDRQRQAAALVEMGKASWWAHDFDQALVDTRQALAIAQEVDDKAVQAAGYFTIGFIHAITAQHDPAREELDHALRLSRQVGDVNQQALVLGFSGHIKNWEGDYDAAARLQAEGLRIAREQNLQVPLMRDLWLYGLSLTGQGRYDDALTTLEESLALSEKLGDVVIGLRALNSLGWLYGECGDFSRALAFNQQGVDGARKWGDPEVIANVELNLADLFLTQGDDAQAATVLDRVNRLVNDPATTDWMKWRYSMRLFVSLGELWLARSELAKAQRFADMGLRVATDTNSRKYLVRGWRLRSNIAQAHRQWNEAEQWMQQALSLAQSLGNPTQLCRTQHAIGRLYTEARRPEQARQAYEAARNVIDRVKANIQTPALHAGLEQMLLLQSD